MTVLTESEVLARSKATDLLKVKHLNCWGSDLTDIGVIRKLLNLEVLNLSANNIISLRDIAYCPRLKELYLRRNHIPLSDVRFLKNLPNLRVLWLASNPAAHGDQSHYKNTVLRNLPQLKKLDNKDVTDLDVENAKQEGETFEVERDVPNFEGIDFSCSLKPSDLLKIFNDESSCFSGSKPSSQSVKVGNDAENLEINDSKPDVKCIQEEKSANVSEEAVLKNISSEISEEIPSTKEENIELKTRPRHTEVSKSPSHEKEVTSENDTQTFHTPTLSIDIEAANERRKQLGLKPLDLSSNGTSYDQSTKIDEKHDKTIEAVESISEDCTLQGNEAALDETSDSKTVSAICLLMETLPKEELEKVASHANLLLSQNVDQSKSIDLL